jgi:peptide/nickel transport system substrate-binding protein
LAVSFLGLSLWSAGCSPPAERPEALDRVRGYHSAAPVSLSLIGKGGDANSEIIAFQITDGLVQYDERLVLQPRLAESWSLSDDRSTVTFRLRRGVTWHDGEPFTARDVLYTVRMVREPAVENRTYGSYFAADRVTVEAPDDYTIRATYSEPTPDMLGAWRLPIVPEHVASLDGTPENNPAGILSGGFAEHPIGCGPFRFVRYVPDQEVVLEANDDYWDGRPEIDQLVFKIFTDQRTAFHAFMTGDLDLMNATSALWQEARESGREPPLDSFVYYRLSVWQTTWNQDGSNPFFTDARVRRAMVLALDRPGFIEATMSGLARPAITAIHPDSAWASPDVKPWPYDPAEAARLLDEAGWVDSDGDGVRDKNGVAFRFTHMVPASSQQIVDQMATWQQQSWAELGIRSTIERLEWGTFRERRNAKHFAAASFSINFSPSPEDVYDLHHSDSRESGWNFAGLNDPEIDRLIDEARTTFDFDRRVETYHRLQERLHELEPITCLFHFATPVLVDSRLKGLTPTPIDYWRTTHGPATWAWEP